MTKKVPLHRHPWMQHFTWWTMILVVGINVYAQRNNIPVNVSFKFQCCLIAMQPWLMVIKHVFFSAWARQRDLWYLREGRKAGYTKDELDQHIPKSIRFFKE
jgi:hypothetical protein